MRTKPIVASLVGIVFLLFIAILLVAVRKASPAVTVRHIQSVRTGDTLFVTVQVSNRTGNDFVFYPFTLEVREGTVWKKYYEFRDYPYHPIPGLTRHSFTNYICEVTNTPAGSVLRLTLHAQEVLTGPKGFLRRAELRLKDKRSNRMPLNPNDKNSKVFAMPIDAVTEEFVVPEPAGDGK